MRDSREAAADGYFACSDAERAAFEAGIKLGSVYHQFVGVPLRPENVSALERAIEAGCRVQPFVESVKVKIDRSRLKRKRGQYDYVSLTGDMLYVDLVVHYRGTRVRATMRMIEEMNYPLMYIHSVERS